jgi:hypothetical protein
MQKAGMVMNDKICEQRLLKNYDGDSDSTEEVINFKSPNHVRLLTILRPWISCVCSILTLITGISILVVLLVQTRSVTHDHSVAYNNDQGQQWKDCGNTSSEARSKNCRFDVMLTSWIHNDCFDSELMESYLFKHDYTWYMDRELTVPFPDEAMRLGDHYRVFVDREFHFVHCAYMWEMQIRAYWAGKAKVYGIWEDGHTKHCANILVSQELPTNWTTLTVAMKRLFQWMYNCC